MRREATARMQAFSGSVGDIPTKGNKMRPPDKPSTGTLTKKKFTGRFIQLEVKTLKCSLWFNQESKDSYEGGLGFKSWQSTKQNLQNH